VPQLVISVTQEGYVVSVRRVETFGIDDAPAFIPPFAAGERITASLFISPTRNSPFLTDEQKAEAVTLLSLFPYGTRVVGEVVPAPSASPTQGETVPAAVLAQVLGRDSGSFVLNPGLLRFVDP
jgi:hypothetical protein